MTHYGPEEIPIWGIILIALLLLTQSSILFIKARRIGKVPWLWGIVGLIQFPVPSIVFWILLKTAWKDRSGEEGRPS
ncbi:sigma-Y antisigma factor component [Halobacillus mangrovi]|uniref:Sigma-Y antisigma factor component n=1 Tax=Halobacillus mangrovi TaxID=402384 RepID=A0A1W5ZYF8_9BACI|nr:sigma-Y antisigma factor component [Halobacillus mangrovi]ARI78322.1 sigma-Y antisigma factor component [Halobacillus mangrovi]